MRLASPQDTERQIGGDAKEPGVRAVVCAYVREMHPRTKESLLRDVACGLVRGKQATKVEVERLLMADNKGIEVRRHREGRCLVCVPTPLAARAAHTAPPDYAYMRPAPHDSGQS